MKLILPLLILLGAQIGCTKESVLHQSEYAESGDSRLELLAVKLSTATSLGLSSVEFDLSPVGASVGADCLGSSEVFFFTVVDAGSGTWEFTGSIPSYCDLPVMASKNSFATTNQLTVCVPFSKERATSAILWVVLATVWMAAR